MYNLLLYSLILVLVIWSVDGINFNGIFKKGRVYQARACYVLIVFSLTYLVSNFVIDFLNCLK